MSAKPIVVVRVGRKQITARQAESILEVLQEDYHVIFLPKNIEPINDIELEVLNMEHIELTLEQKEKVESKIQEIMDTNFSKKEE